jgi:hypothetical protein
MTVGADHITFLYLSEDRCPATGGTADRAPDLKLLPSARKMVEIEHHGVGLTAVDAGVFSQVVDQMLEVALSVARLDPGHPILVLRRHASGLAPTADPGTEDPR